MAWEKKNNQERIGRHFPQMDNKYNCVIGFFFLCVTWQNIMYWTIVCHVIVHMSVERTDELVVNRNSIWLKSMYICVCLFVMNWMTPSIDSNIAVSTQMQFDYGHFLTMSIVSIGIKFVRLPHFMERLAIKQVRMCFLFCWWKTYVPLLKPNAKIPINLQLVILLWLRTQVSVIATTTLKTNAKKWRNVDVCQQ